ncbi:MAG: glycosyltransferase family 39 protein [Caldimonas sp.]
MVTESAPELPRAVADAAWPGIAARQRSLPLLLALAAWLSFTAWLRPLNLPEEGRYVGVAWEMMRSGDWLVPTLNGLPFFHKPPLFYWLTALSMELFGPSAGAARLAPLVGATAAAWALFLFIRRWVGGRPAAFTLLVLATQPFFFGGAQFANLDMLVASLIALTIVLAAHAALARQAGQPWRTALAAAWACAGLAVLAKGLIGLVLPSLVLGAWLVACRQPAAVLRLLSWPGLALFTAVTVPWFVFVQLRFPGFFHYFFVYQHVERFVATGFNNVQPWWFFFVALPGLTLPWSLWLLGVRRVPVGEERTVAGVMLDRLMWVWVLAIVAFFSIPSSKPVGYMMPVLFPLAFIVYRAAAAALKRRPALARPALIASLVGAVGLCLGAAVFSRLTYTGDNTELGRTLGRLKGPDDRVVFVDQYFYDVPLHAGLRRPVEVTGRWNDPGIARTDNWRRELAEAAPFAPGLAAGLLVDAPHALSSPCGGPVAWAVARRGAERIHPQLRAATLATEAHGTVLWRIAPDCSGNGAAETRMGR